ncbi:MAG: sensor histidine kinase [Bernardetiaceae bacterium]|nr:sensor histidine kinase [Bernardetiaceae bacterium]
MALPTLAQPSWPQVVLETQAKPRDFTRQLPLLADPTAQFTWAQAQQLMAEQPPQVVWGPGVPLSKAGAYWFKLVVVNQTGLDQTHALVFANKFHVNEIDVFVVSQGQLVRQVKAGTYRPRSQLTDWRFGPTFVAQNGGLTEVYVRLQNFHGYPVAPGFTLQKAEQVTESRLQTALTDLLIINVFVIMAIYNLLLFFTNRDRAYLYYVGYMLSLAVLFLFQTYYLFGYCLPQRPEVSSHVYFLVVDLALVCYVLFSNRLFDAPVRYPKVAKANRWFVGISLAKAGLTQALLFATQNYQWADLTLMATTLVQVGFIIWALYQFRREIAGPGFWVIVGTGLMALAIVAALGFNLPVVLGWANQTLANSFYTIQLGGIAEAVCFSLALGAKARLAERKSREAQADMLRLQEEHTQALEQLVRERTLELEEAYQSLNQQKEEISTLAENLEDLVRERTFELELALQNLARRNREMEEFSDIISHNLRAPVARFQGLLNLLDISGAEVDRDEVQLLLQQSSRDLDEVLHDLNYILEIRKRKDLPLELVSLYETAKQAVSRFEPQIVQAQAQVLIDIKEEYRIRSVRPYLQSIFSQLVDNAVKFRSPNRPLQLHLSAQLGPDQTMHIAVKDNGLGINSPDDDPQRIFGLYRRMNTQFEGKGLGLFLVKTQVEALNGRIEVESRYGTGSEFRVYLPSTLRVG